MFATSDQSAARDARHHRSDRAAGPGTVSQVDVRSLQPGTIVLVETGHSQYRFTVLEQGSAKALIQGGRFFDQETEGRIEGATFGGSLIKIGWIESGLLLEISVGGRRLITSGVRSIHVTQSNELLPSNLGSLVPAGAHDVQMSR